MLRSYKNSTPARLPERGWPSGRPTATTTCRSIPASSLLRRRDIRVYRLAV